MTSMLAEARPAGPDAPWGADELPTRRDDALEHDTALILQHIRMHHPAFKALSRRAWDVFSAIACFMRRNNFALPSQATLRAMSGYSPRSQHRALRELRAAGVLVTWSMRLPDGRATSLRYAYGPIAQEAFADVVERYPRGPGPARARPLAPGTSSAVSPKFARSPSATVTTRPVANLANKPQKRIPIKPSSCEDAADPATPRASTSAPSSPAREAAALPKEEAFYGVTSEDRAVAKEALALRAQRKSPKAKVPTWWDRPVVELVAARVAQTPGTADEKLEVQRLALGGAWLASRDQAPTVRFIWENQEHFLEHVERGRKKSRNDAWQARREAEAKRGGEPHPSPALASRKGAQVPSREKEGTPAKNSAPMPRDTETRASSDEGGRAAISALSIAEERRAQREDSFAHAREEARQLAFRRAEAQRAAAALAAAWGENLEGVATTPPVDAEKLRAARREVEAELAALRRAVESPPQKSPPLWLFASSHLRKGENE